MSQAPQYTKSIWIDFINEEFLGGLSLTKFHIAKPSALGGMLDPGLRPRRREAAVFVQQSRDEIERLTRKKKELSDRITTLGKEFEKPGMMAAALTETDLSDLTAPGQADLYRLRLAIDSAQAQHKAITERLRDLEQNRDSINARTGDELSARADLELEQIEQLEKYLAWKRKRAELIRAFKRYELEEDDGEKYWQALAMLIKRLELPPSALGEWDWLFLGTPEERANARHYGVGGFINRSMMPIQSVDPDPNRLNKMLKEFFESVDDSQLEKILGIEEPKKKRKKDD